MLWVCWGPDAEEKGGPVWDNEIGILAEVTGWVYGTEV